MGLDDFLDKFNLLSRVQGAVWSLGSYLPHRASHKGRKVGAWRVDGGTREIRVDRWHTTGGQAEGLPETEEGERSGPAEADKGNLQAEKRKRGGLLRELW